MSSGTVTRDHAKLLWQRIPQDMKESHTELGQLWAIGKCLWRRDFAAVYGLASNPSWPEYVAPMVTNLVGKPTELAAHCWAFTRRVLGSDDLASPLPSV